MFRLRYMEYSFAFLVVCLTSIFALQVSKYQFGGYDLSPVIDLQARIERGEIPGINFISTLPFTMILLIKIQTFFGGGWFSLIWLNVALFGISVVLVLIFWPTCLGTEKLLLTILLMTMPLLYTNHLWHSAMSQFIAIDYLVVTLNYFLEPESKWGLLRQVVLALLSGLLFFSKQNLGLPLLFVVVGIIAISGMFRPEMRRSAMIFVSLQVFGVISVAGSLMLVFHTPLSVLIHSFTFVVGRTKLSAEQLQVLLVKPKHILFITLFSVFYLLLSFKRSKRQIHIETTFLGAVALLIATVELYRRNYDWVVLYTMIAYLFLLLGHPKKQKLLLLVLGVSLVVSQIPLVTDWDTNFNHAILPMFCMLLLTNLVGYELKSIVWVSTLIAIFAATAGGIARQRMHDVGPGAFWESAKLKRIDSGYFDGIYVGPHMIRVRNEIRVAIDKAGKSSRVFCGPRIEFCYEDNHLSSPPGLPLWWHPGSSYPLWMEKEVVNRFKMDRFTLIIFLHDDRTRIPQKILEYIDKNYIRLNGFDDLDVYRPRTN